MEDSRIQHRRQREQRSGATHPENHSPPRRSSSHGEPKRELPAASHQRRPAPGPPIADERRAFAARSGGSAVPQDVRAAGAAAERSRAQPKADREACTTGTKQGGGSSRAAQLLERKDDAYRGEAEQRASAQAARRQRNPCVTATAGRACARRGSASRQRRGGDREAARAGAIARGEYHRSSAGAKEARARADRGATSGPAVSGCRRDGLFRAILIRFKALIL